MSVYGIGILINRAFSFFPVIRNYANAYICVIHGCGKVTISSLQQKGEDGYVYIEIGFLICFIYIYVCVYNNL